MLHKKIGICVTSLHIISVHQLLTAIGKEANKLGYHLQIWAPFSDLYYNSHDDLAQEKIFEHIPYQELSGLILFTEQIKNKRIVKQIADNARQFDVPVISLKHPVDGCFNISYDSEKALGHIIEHLIHTHHCQRINFISGLPDNPVSADRIAVYKKVLTAHHIPIEEDRIGYGDFWADPAIKATEHFLESSLPLPDAIVCANDAMAMAVCDCLSNHGYRIPEDIIVTGLGGIQERDYHFPLLTTAVYDPTLSSTYIFDALKHIWSNIIPKDANIKIPCQLLLSESCGCACHNNQESQMRLDGLYRIYQREHDYRHSTHSLTSTINSDCNLNTLANELPNHVADIGISSMNLFLQTDYTAIRDLDLDIDQLHRDNYVLINQIISGNSQIPLRELTKEEICIENERLCGESNQILSIPINVEEKSFGILSINYQGDTILHQSLYELVITLDNILDNIQNRFNLMTVNQQLNKLSEQTILSLAEIVEAKSEFTGLHIKRVSEYTRILASAMNYPPEDVEIIRIASMMHDIGKINIPSSILEKPAKLTKEEFDVIKTHVTEGAKLLRNSPGPIMETASRIALEHHEKWDGTGYLGKKGNQIALESRIVALADVFDALVSQRPYKKPFSVQQAYDMILEESGSHFDPDVVRAFQEHIEEFEAVKENYQDN